MELILEKLEILIEEIESESIEQDEWLSSLKEIRDEVEEMHLNKDTHSIEWEDLDH